MRCKLHPIVGGICLAAAMAVGCSVHDATLLDPESKQGLTAGDGNGGSGGMPMSMPPPSSPCGNGALDPGEKCDTDIPAGSPGACPSSCPSETCMPMQLAGSECQVECVRSAVTCRSGDGCCPSVCNADSDADCSSDCGNGELDSDQGETCEDGTDTPCPTEADCDDDDPCTMNVLSGSADNCNAACSNPPASAADGDGCCPDGANANVDDDCTPMCGNDVVESGEDCDGSADCNDQCEIALTAEQMDCIDRFTVAGATEDCQRCACIQCTQEVFSCRDDTDTDRRMKCDALINCALGNDCNGQACYCGDNPSDPLCLAPVGPCITETENAANNPPLPTDILARTTDTNYALGRATTLGTCTAAMCPEFCPL